MKRKDSLNCEHIVEEKYCPNCGQQNIKTRQQFHYLFTHFIEDFTHYDGQFWGTLKNLVFKPGKLTNTYLEGKRQKFVPPVKLYIFISFITFFLFAVFPPFSFNFEGKIVDGKEKKIALHRLTETSKQLDSIRKRENINGKDSVTISKVNALLKDSIKLNSLQNDFDMSKKLDDNFKYNGYTSRKSFDSAKAKNPSFYDFINVPIAHKFFELKEQGVAKGEILKKLGEVSFHNLPKALFIYLPIFAFFLWIFHDKKKWWYFDHGIFTLHYFSFLLLTILAFSLLYKLADATHSLISIIIYIMRNVLFFYSIIYFFIAHHKVYHTHGVTSFIIGSILFMINFFAFLFLVVGLGIISFLMIH
ncbi:DUF3667 domain-containing protein [Epilithonimonas vandammei]|uniref:DUF3667 domain-containing protein n=1 Tax=Epilithonimonas vandammei TaxID=2487072 RepID=A0A3G8YDC5_9FLAO|nr:DUF3667 domain-containing protein [Epilithonimonas vandammei]AZI39231.1 DUF3667 domain-containing protein [Epilithonimonas vandammei]